MSLALDPACVGTSPLEKVTDSRLLGQGVFGGGCGCIVGSLESSVDAFWRVTQATMHNRHLDGETKKPPRNLVVRRCCRSVGSHRQVSPRQARVCCNADAHRRSFDLVRAHSGRRRDHTSGAISLHRSFSSVDLLCGATRNLQWRTLDSGGLRREGS